MTQSVWHKQDIARIAAGGVVLAPSWEFAAGVAWLAAQFGADVKLPERPAAVIVIDAAGREVGR
ncbi:MAG: hypothetical protein WA040_05200 [Anaerolineae bacterium]